MAGLTHFLLDEVVAANQLSASGLGRARSPMQRCAVPDSSWTTLDVRSWLRERDVDFDPSDSHLALCALAALVADGGVAEAKRQHPAVPPQFDSFGNLLVELTSYAASLLLKLRPILWIILKPVVVRLVGYSDLRGRQPHLIVIPFQGTNHALLEKIDSRLPLPYCCI